jgi:pilus assembly protein FimV
MHSTHRLPLKSSALKKLTAAVASALVLSSAAHAAGLGKLTVLSALGQPLRAEIELTSVSPDEASGLVAKLASPDAFKTANIEFNPALLSLRFNVEQRGGRQFIRVSSSQPLNEPFVDLLLELSWNNGRLVREYTFLLDPAELRATQSAQVAASDSTRARSEAAPAAARARADETRPAAERPAATRRAPEERADTPARTRPAAGSEYRVRPGDSLGKIAAQLKPAEVSLDMMLVALYRANPDAFMGNNMNRLKSGRILAVPGADAVGAIGDGEAHGVVVAHAADFNAYRNKLAGQVGASEAEKTPRASQSGTGKISAKVEERPTAANESQDQLRLSKAAPSAPAVKGATTSTEDTIAKQRELQESQTRVKELERNITDLQKLAEVKNKAGAEAQNNASAPAAAPAAKAPDAVVAENKPAPNKLPPIKPAATAANKPAAAAPASAPEPGLFDFIMDNLTYLGAGAAVLLLAALGIAQRRKKATVKAVSEPSILGVPTEPQHSMFAEAGGQSVDTNNSVFNSSFAPSASQLDTNEVDPVAEADVYIAYGRDAQAEEILKEALRTHPERLPVRLKLLEIYASRKDQRAFETQASELYGITRGHGDEWAQAAALGRAIDPHNPLYAAGGPALGGAAAAGLAAGAVGAGVAAAAAAAPAHDDLLSKDLDDAFLAADAADSAHGGIADTPREPMSFDQHFAGAMATAQPAAAVPTPAPAPADDDNLLDFDLGGLAFEPHAADQTALPTPDVREITASNDVPDLEFDMGAFESAPVAPAPAPAPVAAQTAPAAAADDPLDFSFDMDFGATPAPNPVPHLDPHLADELLPVPGSAPNTDIDMANLAREFDLPDLPSELHTGIPATPETASRATALKDPLFDLDAMDFGLEDKQPAAQGNPAPDLAFDLDDTLDDTPPAATPALALELDDDPFALPALDGLPPATPAPVESAAYAPHGLLEPQLEAPGFDLDLADELDTPSLPLPEVHDIDAGADAPAGELSPAHMEMETKLDLAIAYQEIGDKEGARELLDEVIKGGTGEQIGRANAMRAALA